MNINKSILWKVIVSILLIIFIIWLDFEYIGIGRYIWEVLSDLFRKLFAGIFVIFLLVLSIFGSCFKD